ncbi:MAG: protein kinase [Myxococcota bacterium]
MKICPSCRLQYPNDQELCFVDNARLEVRADPWIGQTLAGRYLVEEVIGEGGMATVYRARHTLVDRPIAVKILSEALAKNPAMRERFRREAKNAAQLAHPNIIEIDDHGETPEGAVFMVMELLEGAPLSDLIAEGPMAAERVMTLGLQLARGLARAHDFDVIHRDLKPENVFVTAGEGGQPLVKLLDFGIARSMHDSRLTSAGEIFGTPQYMAPERVTSIDAGPAADLYALGCILFEMLVGSPPFAAQEITGYFIAHMQQPPPKPSERVRCPARLEALILSLLEKRPEDRPVDAHQVIKVLQALAPTEEDTLEAPPITGLSRRPAVAPTLPPTTLERWARRTAIFEEMLARAHPAGAPPDLRQLLDGIRNTLQRVHAIRSAGLKEQRALEAVGREARETRARLGFAVQSLAEDLSAARETVRDARAEVQPYLDAESQAKGAYRTGLAQLADRGGFRTLEVPDPGYAATLHAIADAVERWHLAHGSADKARRWVEAKEREVKDLDFQIQALRANLAKVEQSYDARRDTSEEALTRGGAEAAEREQELIGLAARFCDALRGEGSLHDLFRKLEAESA